MKLALAGKTALVTGSDARTGEVIAQTLLDEGAQVVWHSNHAAPDKPLAVVGDVATESGCSEIIQQLADKQVNVDILVNNYGTADNHSWENSDTDKWLEMYQINVLSAVRLAQALSKNMVACGWGRIVNLSTIGSHQPAAERPAYYAAKAALANMSVSLMQSLAGTGVTVNTVSPGLIRTDQVEAIFRAQAKKHGKSEDWSDIEKHIAAKVFPNSCGRIAERQEVADLVAFLCSSKAGFINGQNIRIDGGAVIYV